GMFISRDLKPGDYQVWTTYTLTARGEASGQVAQTSYQDAPLPGHEWEMLPKQFSFRAPWSDKELSVESDKGLFKLTPKNVEPIQARRRHHGGVSPQDASCSLPALSGKQIFNTTLPLPFSDEFFGQFLGIELTRQGCIAFKGTVSASGNLDPFEGTLFARVVINQ